MSDNFTFIQNVERANEGVVAWENDDKIEKKFSGPRLLK